MKQSLVELNTPLSLPPIEVFNNWIFVNVDRVSLFTLSFASKECYKKFNSTEKTKDNLNKYFTCAVQCGYINITEWMKEAWPDCIQIHQNNLGSFGNIKFEYYTTHASAHGHLPMLKHLLERGYPCNLKTFTEAAKNGHLDILKWMCQLEKDDLLPVKWKFYHSYNDHIINV
jgi:hypothetical protein